MAYALITGASSGIGLEFARVYAREGYSLVLASRDALSLNNAKDSIQKDFPSVDIKVAALDLATLSGAEDLYHTIKSQGIFIEVLVNNAGFGDFASIYEADWAKLEAMVLLNIMSLTHLTKLFLVDMVAQKRGTVLNVASTAAFLPGPLMAVYYATKAYVLSFSEALSNELDGTGVSVTVLCPGPTKSGFQAAANLQNSNLSVSQPYASAKAVAEFGFKSAKAKKVVAIPGVMNKLTAFAPRLFPRSVVVKLVRRAQERRMPNEHN